MSYAMTHLEIAYQLLDKYEWIINRADFIMGSVAPDAVHFHKNYEVQLKEHSHLWNCGPKWGITTQSPKWKSNILNFWEEHKKDDNRDFIAGYCVHLLTDWLNDLRIWSPFRVENINDDNVEEIYHIYGKEASESDFWLYQQSRNRKDIMNLLRESRTYEIPGCITREDVECQKAYLLEKQYANKENYEISNFKYCTEKVIRSFIGECVETFSREKPCLLHF